jgi:hypothetical protein
VRANFLEQYELSSGNIVLAKSNFRIGGANLRVCLNSPQGIATISGIAFGKQFGVFPFYM